MLKNHLIAAFASISVVIILGMGGASDASRVRAQGPDRFKPVVSQAVKSDHSSPIARLHASPVPSVNRPHLPIRKSGTVPRTGQFTARDPLLTTTSFSSFMPMPIKSFEGTRYYTGTLNIPTGMPPDPNGDIGYDPSTGKRYYVQWVNFVFAIYDVTNTPIMVYGPAPGNTFWQGFGGPCETTNSGDPTTLFDPLAHRWLMSQLALPNGAQNGPFYQCIAVSTSADPSGSYYRYQFQTSADKLEDYPKFGVWQDAYYMSTNQFDSYSNFLGGGAFAFERARLLIGDPTAREVYFDLGLVNGSYGGQLPSDFDGTTPPPPGAPNYFAEMDKAGVLLPNQDALGIWEFHVDWSNPANSSFGLAGKPNVAHGISSFNLTSCEDPGYSGCVEQPAAGGTYLDAVSDRLMYRLQYRRYGDRESLLTNRTVNLGPYPGMAAWVAHAGIRWYEMSKSPGGNWTIYQEGTYGPDENSRWMGSIAADAQGNIALGYSISSLEMYPSIRYAGRLATDARGLLPQGEVGLSSGTGYQTYLARWGDYTMLSIDPQDDCTFWYTNEYYQIPNSLLWQTRIGSFRFPSCGTASSPPSAPSGLSATASASVPRVDLHWTQSDKTDVAGYIVYRDGAYLAMVADATTTLYTDTPVTVATIFNYTVDAYNGLGVHSARSAQARAQTPNSYTMIPLADAYVEAKNPTISYGTSSTLRVDNSPDTRSYLRFDVQGWKTDATAVLRVYVTSSNSTGFSVRYVENYNWSEDTITYNNAPYWADITPVASGPLTSGTWALVDVSSLVRIHVRAFASRYQPFNLVLTSSSNSAITLASRETGANAPQLVLGATAIPTPTPTATATRPATPPAQNLFLPYIIKPAPVTPP